MGFSWKRSSTTDAPPSWWRRALDRADRALDVVYPPTCIECEGLIEFSESSAEGGLGGGHRYRHICPACASKMLLVRAPHCTTCGYPFFGAVAEAGRECPHCAGLVPQYREGRTATLLQGPVRRLVHGIKYESALHLLADVRTLVRANPHFREHLAGARLVPVPLHRLKLRDRGYNQAELLARCFAEVAPGATVAPLLERVVWTSTQTRLDRQARRENLKNAFALAKGAPVIPTARHVLVDDVFTTGATLNACAVALRRAGVTSIDVATLGHG